MIYDTQHHAWIPVVLTTNSVFWFLLFSPTHLPTCVSAVCSPSLCPTESAMPCRPPTPSPPPTTKHAFTPGFSPSFSCRSALADCSPQKPGLMGRPWRRICSGARPQPRARTARRSLGTKHASTSRWNLCVYVCVGCCFSLGCCCWWFRVSTAADVVVDGVCHVT